MGVFLAPAFFILGGKMTTFRMARFIRQISQKRLSLISGVGQSTISQIETGSMRPLPHHREKLAKALDVPVDELEFVTDYEDMLAAKKEK